MHIIKRTTLKQFWEKYPDAQQALQTWYTRAKHASWKNISEVRMMYPSADKVRRLTVFNIRGNRYRLIVRIEYERQTIYIRHILTHKEYSKGFWKNDAWY